MKNILLSTRAGKDSSYQMRLFNTMLVVRLAEGDL